MRRKIRDWWLALVLALLALASLALYCASSPIWMLVMLWLLAAMGEGMH